MEGTLMVLKTFRGTLTDGEQDKIRLTTTDGRVGYRIIKFQLLGQDNNSSYENTTKIYNTKQATITGSIDFSETDLLAAGLYFQNSVGQTYPLDLLVIFDKELFNQDIYITCKNAEGSGYINYYIELEQIKLTVIQAETLIVKDLRGEMWTRPAI